jgi:hypothetical protein
MGAPLGNKNAVGNKGGGRVTEYRPQYCDIAKAMCRLGATNANLADAFGVGVSTISGWMVTFVEFADALKEGKSAFDDLVERALAQRAIGYDYTAEKVFCNGGEIVRAEYREHLPADVGAAKLWLTNRRRDQWADSSKISCEMSPESPLAKLARQLEGTAIRPREY